MFHRRSAPLTVLLHRSGHHWRARSRERCVRDYVRWLTGQSAAERPRCVDPALAALTRGVSGVLSGLAGGGVAGVGARDDERLSAWASRSVGTAGTPRVHRLASARHSLLTALACAQPEHRLPLLIGLLGVEESASGRALRGPLALDMDTEWLLLRHQDVLPSAVAFVRQARVRPGVFVQTGLPLVLDAAVQEIATAAGPRVGTILPALVESSLTWYEHGAHDRSARQTRTLH